MGGSGWGPGFLFGQAAKISHNAAFLCQLGPVALHKGGRLVLEGRRVGGSEGWRAGGVEGRRTGRLGHLLAQAAPNALRGVSAGLQV